MAFNAYSATGNTLYISCTYLQNTKFGTGLGMYPPGLIGLQCVQYLQNIVGRRVPVHTRWKMFGNFQAGLTMRKIARPYGVSHTQVSRLVQRWQDTDNVVDRSRSGRPRCLRERSPSSDTLDTCKPLHVSEKAPGFLGRTLWDSCQSTYHKQNTCSCCKGGSRGGGPWDPDPPPPVFGSGPPPPFFSIGPH